MMKRLTTILLLALCGCSASNKAPEHVRTERQGKYFLDSLKRINRAAIVRDSLENEMRKP